MWRLFVLILLIGLATAADLEKSFNSTYDAYRQGDWAKFNQHRQALNNTPLAAYSEYWHLEGRVNKIKMHDIDLFAKKYPDFPYTDKLRTKYLQNLGAKRQWTSLLQHTNIDVNDPQLACYSARAKVANKQLKIADAAAPLWHIGKSQPKACDPLFEQFQKSGIGRINNFKRIESALANGNRQLARYLLRFLSKSDQKVAKEWFYLERRPTRILSAKLPKDHPYTKHIAQRVINKIIARDTNFAVTNWAKLKKSFNLGTETWNYLYERLAVAMAKNHHSQAGAYLAKIPANKQSDEVIAWLSRDAIWNGKWNTLLNIINNLSEAEAQKSNWQYWKARALEAQGNKSQAKEIYRTLAQSRHYYGFLAANRIGQSPRLNAARTALDNHNANKLQQTPGIARAMLLKKFGHHRMAKVEWFNKLSQLDPFSKQTAGIIAEQHGWHHWAILSFAQSGHLDDINRRFPVIHKDTITKVAKKHKLDPEILFAIARQESAYDHEAISPAGARGLLQVMPATGKWVAKTHNIPFKNTASLIDVHTNVSIGGQYFYTLLEDFGHPALALAAYNAGPNRIKRWLPPKDMDADIWIENIPFNETRNYVSNIMAYTIIYQSHLGRKMDLSKFTKTINKA